VHFQNARARNKRQRFAVFRVFEILAISILAIGGRTAIATTSAATTTAASAATPAATAAVVSAATTTTLTVAVSSTAAPATAAAPTTLLLHVIEHLKQDPLSERPIRETASTGPRDHKPRGSIHSKSGKRENSRSKSRARSGQAPPEQACQSPISAAKAASINADMGRFRAP
jgi:hypothetical protein